MPATPRQIQESCFTLRQAIRNRDPLLYDRAAKPHCRWPPGTPEHDLHQDLRALDDMAWAIGCGQMPSLDSLQRVERLFQREGVRIGTPAGAGP
jgi:hypothetical protein